MGPLSLLQAELVSSQVSERGLFKNATGGVGDALPDAAHRASLSKGAVIHHIGLHAAGGREWAFEGQHHFGQADIGRRPSEHMAALRPAPATDDSGLAQRDEQLIEVVGGDIARLGDLGALHITLAMARLTQHGLMPYSPLVEIFIARCPAL